MKRKTGRVTSLTIWRMEAELERRDAKVFKHQLVKIVKDFPSIWDKFDPTYRHKERLIIWNEIAEEMSQALNKDVTGKTCANSWKNMYDQLRAYRVKEVERKKIGKSSEVVWEFWQPLQYVVEMWEHFEAETEKLQNEEMERGSTNSPQRADVSSSGYNVFDMFNDVKAESSSSDQNVSTSEATAEMPIFSEDCDPQLLLSTAMAAIHGTTRKRGTSPTAQRTSKHQRLSGYIKREVGTPPSTLSTLLSTTIPSTSVPCDADALSTLLNMEPAILILNSKLKEFRKNTPELAVEFESELLEKLTEYNRKYVQQMKKKST